MRFVVVKEDGKLRSNGFKEHLVSIKNGTYVIEITKSKANRSNNQNRFYWGVFLDALCDYMGETIPEMDEESRQSARECVHRMLKEKFLKNKKTVTIRNPKDRRQKVTIETEASTASLTTEEFEKYLESIRVYFGKWGVSLPYPHEDPVDLSIFQ